MISKRRLLASMLHHSGVLYGARRAFAPRLLGVNYHRIWADGAKQKTELDGGVYGPTASRFEAEVRWLAKNFRLLSEDELLERVTGGRWPVERAAIITFDDGYRDQYTLARPILKRLGAPAIFFVPAHLITSRRLGWWDLIAWLIKHSRRGSLTVDGGDFQLPRDREQAIRYYHGRLKLEPRTRTAGLIDRLSAACDTALPDAAAQDRELMTWDEVRACADDGISIGSHGNTHAVLATLNAAEQEVELRESRTEIERRIGQKVRSLSYPVGNYAHFTPETQAIAERCGYLQAFSFGAGLNPSRGLNRYDIRRISGGSDEEAFSAFAAAATWPSLFG